MPLLPVPIAANRADDLLPAARVLVDAISNAFIADPTVGVSCAAACTACCHHPVPVTPAEVRSIVDAIERLPTRRREDIEQRIAETAAGLADAGLSAAGFADVSSDGAARHRLATRYFGLGVACPLLHDGVCSIRDDRPLVCREYLVTSDPRHCAEPGQGREQVVRIRSDANVLGGFAGRVRAFRRTPVSDPGPRPGGRTTRTTAL